MDRIGAPLCRVVEDLPTASGITFVKVDGGRWSARDRRVYHQPDGNEPALVRQEECSVLGLTCTSTLVWSVTVDGAFCAFKRDGNAAVCGHLRKPTTSMCWADGDHLLIATESDDGKSEVVLISPHVKVDGVVHGVSARGLFRITGSVAALCASRTATETVVATVSVAGDIDLWSFTAEEDLTAQFGNPTVPLGTDTVTVARILGSRRLWIGTAGGDVFDVQLEPLKCSRLAKQHEASVTGIVVLGDGERVWTASLDGSIVVWDSRALGPVGSFHTGTTGVARLFVGEQKLITDLYLGDTLGGCSWWTVSERVHYPLLEEPSGPAQPSTANVLRQLSGMLAGDPDAALPSSVMNENPEARFVSDALLSMADCTAALAGALEDFGLEPSTLLQDFKSILDIARAAKQLDARCAQAGFHNSSSDELAALSESVRQSISARTKQRTESDALNQRFNEQAEAHREQMDETRRERKELIATVERLRNQADVSLENASSAAQLREDLEAKNAFVLELLQIVKDNTTSMDELRLKLKRKKTEAVEAQRVAQHATAQATRLSETLQATIREIRARDPSDPLLTRLLSLS
jgi:WD40 repeat protein